MKQHQNAQHDGTKCSVLLLSIAILHLLHNAPGHIIPGCDDTFRQRADSPPDELVILAELAFKTGHSLLYYTCLYWLAREGDWLDRKGDWLGRETGRLAG